MAAILTVGRFAARVLPLVVMTAALWAQAPSPSSSWLDRPLTNWNAPGSTPAAAAGTSQAGRTPAPRVRLLERCRLELLTSTAAERSVAQAGLIPFLNFDQSLVRGDVEIVGGMHAADAMCRPVEYNLFVYVSGRLAGTLSPVLMTAQTDASSGAVRILDGDVISAEFARYVSKDALCCPSSRITVRYRLDRSGPQPLVVPLDVRTTRTF